VIYWFTGASTQAVTTGAYRAVEFIKANIRLEGVEKASVEDSKKVVQICTQYAQKGMFNIFMTVFFSTLAFAFVEPFFFIGYLISIAIFGLYQAIFMANAGGAWDNAKKVVEVDLKMKGTPLHDATVVGDTVGDPFKDTSSVAMNPVIKFTTLFGLLAVELAVSLTARNHGDTTLTHILALAVRPRVRFSSVALVPRYANGTTAMERRPVEEEIREEGCWRLERQSSYAKADTLDGSGARAARFGTFCGCW
jgi:K(+)-stimulated pyrophosphate-energized sodium pump